MGQGAKGVPTIYRDSNRNPAPPTVVQSTCTRTHLHQLGHPLQALRLATGGPAPRLPPRAAAPLLVPAAKEALKQHATQGGRQAVPPSLQAGSWGNPSMSCWVGGGSRRGDQKRM